MFSRSISKAIITPDKYEATIKAIYAIIFFATPYRGTHLASTDMYFLW